MKVRTATPRVIIKVCALKYSSINVGGQKISGVVCPECVVPVVIAPESLLEAHLERHLAVRAAFNQPKSRYRRGRTPGPKARSDRMSSTGVERNVNIRVGNGRKN